MRQSPSKPKPPQILNRLLESPAAVFVATHRVICVMLPWLALRLLQVYLIAPNSDVRRYYEASSQWVQGLVPYKDFLLEYPPGALMLFTVPRLLTDSFVQFSHLFAVEMLCVDLGILWLLALLPARLANSPSPLPPSKTPLLPAGPDALTVRYDANVGLMAYLAFSTLSGSLGFERYDLAMALCMLGFLYTAVDYRRPYLADFLLCMGIWMKLVPLLVVPVYGAYLYASSANLQPAFHYKQLPPPGVWLRRFGLRRIASLSGFILLLFVPFYVMAGEGLWTFLRYHQARGLQLESLYSSLFELVHIYTQDALSFTPAFGAAEMVNPTNNYIRAAATASSLLTVVTAAAVSVWYGYKLINAATQARRNYLLSNAIFALTLVMIALNKVLSPQYLLWLAPLAPLAFLDEPLKRRQVLLGTLVATFTTSLIWQFYYRNLLSFDPFAVYVLLSRNFLLLALMIYAIDLPAFFGAPSRGPDGPQGPEGKGRSDTEPTAPAAREGLASAMAREAHDTRDSLAPAAARGARDARDCLASAAAHEAHEAPGGRTGLWQTCVRWISHPNVAAIALGLCAFWIFVANLSETTANDIWIQLRSGADIWQSKHFPSTEVYSATVLNRPFIAHEWLTSVIFFGLVSAFGPAGLSFLAAFVALGVFVLLYYTQPPEQRRTCYYVPLLVGAVYLVSFRILVRPHIFTIVAQACLLLALERFRRHGRWQSLVWLPAMQLVWVNLHGAAFFGPAMLFMVAGLVAAMVVFPGLQNGSESRTFGSCDIALLGGTGVAMALACLVNPYGLGLLQFSIDLLNNEYAKSRVWEWTSPFLQSNLSYYWFWLYTTALVLLWVSVVVRLHTLPVIDFALAALVTFLSVRANRFVPDFAIFAFPVIARSCYAISRVSFNAARLAPKPWIEMGLASLLFANATTYGYAHSAREHRPPIGWGFGGDMPYQEVDLIKKMNLKGIIFNEYSDGALIIHSLVPQVRPVLDSRIDLYPLDLVDEYDHAYVSADYFKRFVRKHHVNLAMLITNRAQPDLLNYLAGDPTWQLLSSTNGRMLYRRLGGTSTSRSVSASN